MGTDKSDGWLRRGLVIVYVVAALITVGAAVAFVHAVNDSDLSPEVDWLPTAATTFSVLGALASLAAIVAFVQWALQQRRRPELHVRWKIASGGHINDLAIWEPDTVAEVQSGLAVVEMTVLNVGDASTTGAQSSFIVLQSVGLQGPQEVLVDRERGMGTRFTGAPVDLAPGMWKLQRFNLTVPDDPGRVFRLTFAVSDGRLNVTGRRSLPSSRLTSGVAR